MIDWDSDAWAATSTPPATALGSRTTAFRTVAWHTAHADTSDVTRTPVPHDMSCAYCEHGLHVYLVCGDGCDCGPQTMPGTAA